MRRFKIPVGLTLAALSVLATTAAAQERPFRGGGMGSVNQSYDPTSTSAELFSLATLTQLGRSGVSIAVDTYWLDFYFENPFPVSVIGSVMFTSHSGNLFAFLDAEFDPATGIMAGTLTLQGGSGRFADATGSATMLIVFDDWTGPFGDPTFGLAIDGMIDY